MSRKFGEHLRKLRKLNTNYNQEDLAKLLKISRSTYTYYETGKSEPGQETLRKLCEILEIDFNTLLTIDDDDRKSIVVASGNIKDGLKKLTPEEEQIIVAYRRMDENDKEFLLRQISSIVKHPKKFIN
jgi:transcriptional regulator with XRE-family HTH domain